MPQQSIHTPMVPHGHPPQWAWGDSTSRLAPQPDNCTYTLLLDDGLEAVQCPSVLGLLRVLYLQPHLQGQAEPLKQSPWPGLACTGPAAKLLVNLGFQGAASWVFES